MICFLILLTSLTSKLEALDILFNSSVKSNTLTSLNLPLRVGTDSSIVSIMSFVAVLRAFAKSLAFVYPLEDNSSVRLSTLSVSDLVKNSGSKSSAPSSFNTSVYLIEVLLITESKFPNSSVIFFISSKSDILLDFKSSSILLDSSSNLDFALFLIAFI